MAAEEQRSWAVGLLQKRQEQLGRTPQKADFDEVTRVPDQGLSRSVATRPGGGGAEGTAGAAGKAAQAEAAHPMSAFPRKRKKQRKGERSNENNA